MRLVKRIFLILGILLVLVISTGAIVASIYEKEVKQYMLEEINKRLNTKIDVKEINFSILKKFPYASLEFGNVTADEVTKNKKNGTLFSAQSIFFQFNLIDIINKNYIIKKITVENGLVNIKIDKNGNDNYHFWKESTDSTNHFNLELESLKFKDFTFYTLNEYKNLDFAIEANSINLSGNLSDIKFNLQTQADLFIHQFNENGKSIIRDKAVELSSTFSVNQETKVSTIKKGELKVQNLEFALTGSIKQLENGVDLNIESKGSDLNIEDLYSLFPSHFQEKLEAYRAKGEITYQSTISGALSSKKSPHFLAIFSIDKGQIVEQKSGIALTNLSVNGSYTNGDQNNSNSSKLILENFNATFGAGSISGGYTITNFSNPYLEIISTAELDLNQAKDFFRLDTLEIAQGQLSINVKYSGYIKELHNIEAKDLQKLNAKGHATIENVTLKLIDQPLKAQNLSGAFKFNNNDILIDSLTSQVSNSSIALTGKFKNLLSYLFIENEPLYVNAQIHSSKLVLDELLLKDEKAVEDSSYTINLPEHINFNLNAAIDTFTFRRFKAENIKGNFVLKNKVLTASQLQLNAVDGSIEGDFTLDNSHPNNVLMTSSANFNNVDIYQLFYQMENFGQKYFVAENIKGRTTTTIDFASVWDEQLGLKKDKLYVLADLTITNGELINYQPALALSKFIEVEELEHIKFATLTTQIEIKNQTIFIPKTDIRSSALDLTISGTHTFNNEIDYRFQMLMNDVLWRKAKSKKKENSEFGYIEDDGLGKASLFLHMTGTVKDYKITYDTKSLREKWKQDFKEEKQTLKQVLKNEFGWFKKDTTLNEETPEEKDHGLQIEWEEDEEKSEDEKKEDKSKKTEDKEKPAKEKKGLGKWLDKIAQPEEEEYEENPDF